MSNVWSWSDFSGGLAENEVIDKPGTYYRPFAIETMRNPSYASIGDKPTASYSVTAPAGVTKAAVCLTLFEDRALYYVDNTTDTYHISYPEGHASEGNSVYQFSNARWNAASLLSSGGTEYVYFIGTTSLASITRANFDANTFTANVTEPTAATFNGTAPSGKAVRPVYQRDKAFALFGSDQYLYHLDGDGTVTEVAKLPSTIVAITRIGDYYRVYTADRCSMFSATDLEAATAAIGPIAIVDWTGFNIAAVGWDVDKDYVLCGWAFGESTSRLYVAQGYGRQLLYANDSQPDDGTWLWAPRTGRLAISGWKLFVPCYSDATDTFGVLKFGTEYSFQQPVFVYNQTVDWYPLDIDDAEDGAFRIATDSHAGSDSRIRRFSDRSRDSNQICTLIGEFSSRRFFGDQQWKIKTTKEIKLHAYVPTYARLELYARKNSGITQSNWTLLYDSDTDTSNGLVATMLNKKITLGNSTSTFSADWNTIQFRVRMYSAEVRSPSVNSSYWYISPKFYGLAMSYDDNLMN